MCTSYTQCYMLYVRGLGILTIWHLSGGSQSQHPVTLRSGCMDLLVSVATTKERSDRNNSEKKVFF